MECFLPYGIFQTTLALCTTEQTCIYLGICIFLQKNMVDIFLSFTLNLKNKSNSAAGHVETLRRRFFSYNLQATISEGTPVLLTRDGLNSGHPNTKEIKTS